MLDGEVIGFVTPINDPTEISIAGHININFFHIFKYEILLSEYFW